MGEGEREEGRRERKGGERGRGEREEGRPGRERIREIGKINERGEERRGEKGREREGREKKRVITKYLFCKGSGKVRSDLESSFRRKTPIRLWRNRDSL